MPDPHPQTLGVNCSYLVIGGERERERRGGGGGEVEGERDKHPQSFLEYRMTRQPTETPGQGKLSIIILIPNNKAVASKRLESEARPTARSCWLK